MILVDTSIWIDHLRAEDPQLTRLLNNDRVLIHDYIIGELAVGSMHNWLGTMLRLFTLPQAMTPDINDVISLLQRENLQGSGLGFIDVALLCMAGASDGVQIWARDKRLAYRAALLGLAYDPKSRH